MPIKDTDHPAFGKKEHKWTLYKNSSGKDMYLVTSRSESDTSVFFLYKNVKGEWQKTAQSADPNTFEDKYIRLK